MNFKIWLVTILTRPNLHKSPPYYSYNCWKGLQYWMSLSVHCVVDYSVILKSKFGNFTLFRLQSYSKSYQQNLILIEPGGTKLPCTFKLISLHITILLWNVILRTNSYLLLVCFNSDICCVFFFWFCEMFKARKKKHATNIRIETN